VAPSVELMMQSNANNHRIIWSICVSHGSALT